MVFNLIFYYVTVQPKNSQLVCLLPVRILNLVMFIWIFIYYCLFTCFRSFFKHLFCFSIANWRMFLLSKILYISQNPLNPLTPASNSSWPTPDFLAFFFKYFRSSESKKINHMHSNHRHKIRIQDFIYLKFNKWTAKIFKNISTKRTQLGMYNL